MQSDTAVRNLYIFDCDGVLVDTNGSKLDLIERVLSELDVPNHFVSWAVDNFRENFGRTRNAHFECFKRYAYDCDIRLPGNFVQQGVAKYALLVEDLYSHCDVILETARFLESIGKEDFFVVSASDQAEAS